MSPSDRSTSWLRLMFSARSRSYSERLNIKEKDEHDKKAATTETIRSLSRGGARGAREAARDRRSSWKRGDFSEISFKIKSQNHDRVVSAAAFLYR